MNPAAPEAILQRLLEGNRRFAQGEVIHPRQDAARRVQLTDRQAPRAAILSCSDSRVPPELVFDQGLGDLFAVRGAGHLADATNLGSLEFAVDALGVRLIVVLGHQNCGAVQAAIEAAATARDPEGHVLTVIEAIRPAVKAPDTGSEEIVHETLCRHVEATAAAVRAAEPVLAQRTRSGDLLVVAAYYSISDGRVQILG